MSFIRKIVRKNKNGTVKAYYIEVEAYWKDGKPKQRYIRCLGTNPDIPTSIPLDKMHFGYIATRLMQDNLTANEVIELVEKTGNRVDVETLEAIGIKYNFKKNEITLSFYQRKKSGKRSSVQSVEEDSSQNRHAREK